MQITKEFRVHEVRATNMANAPFQITLQGNPLKLNQENLSYLTLNADTCARYSIPMSLDLIGRTLVCLFESRQHSLQHNPLYNDFFDNDELQIQSLKKTETVLSLFYSVPPSKYNEVSRTLELSSFGGGDGMHMHIMPCPFYRFIIELTDEEYEACKALPAHSIFKVSFSLA